MLKKQVVAMVLAAASSTGVFAAKGLCPSLNDLVHQSDGGWSVSATAQQAGWYIKPTDAIGMLQQIDKGQVTDVVVNIDDYFVSPSMPYGSGYVTCKYFFKVADRGLMLKNIERFMVGVEDLKNFTKTPSEASYECSTSIGTAANCQWY